MLVHEADGLLYDILPHQSIGIQQQDIFADSLPYRHIVGSGEAQVVVACNECDFGKAVGKIFHGVVFGMVVHDEYLRFHPIHGSLYRHETLLKVVLHVVAHYDY